MQRTFRILLLIAACFWYGVFVPGHQRGAITLSEPAAGVSSCCPTTQTCHESQTPGERSPSEPAPQGRCAVCYLVATTTVVATIHFDLPSSQCLRELTAPTYHGPAPLAATGAFYRRGPPHFLL